MLLTCLSEHRSLSSLFKIDREIFKNKLTLNKT